jgi:hypothetical protein
MARHRVGWWLCSEVLLAALTFPSALEARPDASAETPEETSWDFRVSANAYFFENRSDYLQPTVAVDHGGLHLEGRYNYEALQTGSLWVGWTFEWGEKVKLTLTPMLGGVFGDLNGVAPGLELDLTWGPLEFYSEMEVVLDVADISESYFYSWSELSGRPLAWLRGGIALQRTRVVASPRQVQWGPLVGVSVWKLVASGYWFNPGQSDAQYWVATIGINF